MRPGMVIANRYRLENLIGAGGMGVVWQATDLELRRVVAVKLGEREQVRREARIGAGLQHPNVIAVYDVAEQDEHRWLVMEFLPARNLAQVLREDGPLPARLVAGIGAQLAGALVAMHERNMVHRDITPGNVLVTEDGVAKLTDLGVATWSQVTRTGSAQAAGTDGYLAPEVLAGGFATPATDLYALGATLSTAVEGSSPDGADRALRTVLARLTDPDPAQRPTSERARELLRRAAAEGAGRRRKLLIAATVGLVAVTTAAIGLLPARDTPAPPAQSTPATSAALGPSFVGDPRTADPCAMLDLAPLARFGQTRTAPRTGPFNSCKAQVELREHGNLKVGLHLRLETGPDVDSYEVPQPPPSASTEPVPVPEAANGDHCRHLVHLPGQYRVVLSARQDQRPPVLCELAGALVRGVLDAYRRGPLPRRTLPAESLAGHTACDLLTAEQLTGPLGTSRITSKTGLGGWSCYWDTPNSDPAVQISFFRDDAPEEGAVRTLAGRQVMIVPEEAGDNKCLASIVFREYPELDGPRTERIEIIWRSARPSAERCAAVTTLATMVAERLR